MNTYFNYLAVAALFTLTSCGGSDSFSGSVVDIELPDHEAKPTLVLHLIGKDTFFTPFADISRSIDEQNPEQITARLTLLRDNSEAASVDLITNVENSYDFSEPLPVEPATYTATMIVSGFETVTATQRMPSPPDINEVRFTKDGSVDALGFSQDEWEIEINDPAGEANYYLFRPLTISDAECPTDDFEDCTLRRSSDESINIAQSPDPLLQDIEGYGFVLNDERIDGQTYTVRISAEGQEAYHFLEVLTLTEDGYRYFLSKGAYDRSEGNPFAEPVNVHENVEAGYGIFLTSNRARFVRRRD